MKNKLLTGLLGFFIAILIITVSIGLPIYIRPFYYLQVDLLGIPEQTSEYMSYLRGEEMTVGKEEIAEAFDDVMNYLTLPGYEFKTGIFKFSESGKSHFEDCKWLFDLNAYALLISLVAITALTVLNKAKIFELWRPFGMNVTFCSGAYLLGGFAVIGGLVAIDFDKAFTIFHKIFFPGKDNWMFDPWTDEVILILPQDFFMNCAILIFASIVLLCLGCIIFSLIPKWRKKFAEEA